MPKRKLDEDAKSATIIAQLKRLPQAPKASDHPQQLAAYIAALQAYAENVDAAIKAILQSD